MRTFKDKSGKEWDAAVGKESYGNMVIILSPRQGNATLVSELNSNRRINAERELQELSDEQLQQRLATATPWK